MPSFSPLDLLAVSDDEQKVIRYLAKHPQSTAAKIADKTKIPLAKLEPLLKDMIDKAQLIEDTLNNEQTFVVNFHGNRRNAHDVSSNVFDIFD
jgi:sugar-specific transcriptional regulator TrmB